MTNSFKENYVKVNKYNIYYRSCGKGKPVVFLHAAYASSRIWLPVMTLMQKRFRVYALDLPGHGKSHPFKENDPLPDMPKIVAGFLRELSLKSVVLVGASRGGLISIQTTVRFPSAISKLVLVDSGGLPDAIRPPPELRPKRLEDIFVDKSIVTKDFINTYVADDAEKARLYEEKRKASLPSNYYLEGILDDIVRVAKPTLIVWGEKDPEFPLVCGYLFKALIKGSKLVVLPEVGHSPNLENPEALSKAIMDFLQH